MLKAALFVMCLMPCFIISSQLIIENTVLSISPTIGSSLSSWFGKDVNESELSWLNVGFVFGAQAEYGTKNFKSISNLSFIQKGSRTPINFASKYKTTLNCLDLCSGVRFYPIKQLSIQCGLYVSTVLWGKIDYHFIPEGPETISGMTPEELGVNRFDFGGKTGISIHVIPQTSFNLNYLVSVFSITNHSNIYNSSFSASLSYSLPVIKSKTTKKNDFL
tara:strand:+ start:3036 stop:3692 length:657 start_codon:yes stop_codon:yes gene_type:complete